ncbi:uncharacterized protein BX663DRAFT_492087 [Cokeromyces recurvatus]|uniref:uncharacterized protein n=1 Tax=Cokeromyces recurvatus TaxID=90255 RepID=UPI00221FDA56|nr:uncharacterized protein BX663DRAFT_492087 [Cokeromyces recurvatus]KAI7907819.1 hypothetical protein BX663DRAFT_492087 [Cokeromyces recurvatus]
MSILDISFNSFIRKGFIFFILFVFIVYFINNHVNTTVTTTKNKLFEKVQQQKEQLEQETSSLEKEILNENILPVLYPKPFEFYKPSTADSVDEKFITYLPHSGFHNQRIELENALLLSIYLNRTLLLPSVYLGNPAFPWLRFDKMYERLLLQTKNGLDYCQAIHGDEPLPTECLNYFRWTTVPWSFFYDFSQLKQHVRIIFRNDLSLEWMKDNLNLKDKDIYLFKDYSPFEFRIYDLPESRTPLSRFINRIEINTLEAIEERVLHFGSLFGSYRVLAQNEEHKEMLRFIRREMIFKNPVLLRVASNIVNRLGGIESFVGIHIRVGDGLFKVRASIQVDDIYHELVNHFTDLSVEELEQKYDNQHDTDRLENTGYEIRQLRERENATTNNSFERPIWVQHPLEKETLQNRLGKSHLSNCQPGDGRNDLFAKTTLFIATDCPNPRSNPLLRKIFATFPCTFVLSDFKEELEELKKIEVIEEKIKLNSYLIPMVDAIISAQGHTFYGTNSSTFSTYIERQLHPVYTKHPIELLGAPLI